MSNECVTSSNIVQVQAFKLNSTYVPQYANLNNPVTKKFTEGLENALWKTLGLSQKEHAKIIEMVKGSIFVDFIVLLEADSPENRTTIYQKLFDEIKFNKTGNLEEYFPVADQLIVVVGKAFFLHKLHLIF